MSLKSTLLYILLIFFGHAYSGEPTYPDLRDSHDPEFQAELDAALADRSMFWDGVKKQDLTVVIADITDLEHPSVAWYNPELMLYAASLPKIAIALGAIVEVDLGNLELDEELHQQLVNMIKHSSNKDATAVFNKVGVERLKEILQDERYGKLYDPERGGGLWCGKSYSKDSKVQRDPLKNLSHGASAIQAARFYYGYLNGTIIDHKYLPLLNEMFGSPGIKHKFVKGVEGRDVQVYRKSGTWSDFHADSGVFVRDDLTYIVVAIRQNRPEAGSEGITGIRIIDDLMLERAARRKSN